MHLISTFSSGLITVDDGTQINHETTPQFVLTIRATNGDGSSEEDVTINVNDLNDPPVVNPSYQFNVAENSGIGDSVGTINATDPDGNDVMYSISMWIAGPGNFDIDSDTGEITVTGPLDFETDPLTTYVFVVEVSDGGLKTTTIVTINVDDANDPPVAVDDSDAAYTIAEDNTLTVTTPTLLDNDTDQDGDNITVAVATVTQPANGTVVVATDGTFVYTPNANFDGIDTFTYQAQDDGVGTPLSNVATVTITVTGDNDAPTAVDDTYTVAEEGTLTVPAVDGVLANDTDPEHDGLTAVLGIDVITGSLALASDGSFVYTAPLNYAGIVTFTYQAQDDGTPVELSNTATVTISVTNENDAPTAVPDPSYATNEDTLLTVPAPGVLAKDTDPDIGDSLTAHLDTDVSNGSLTLNSDGSFSYTPDLNFNGTDTFTYHAEDSDNEPSNTTTVTITVNAVNDPPTAVPDPDYTTDEDTTLTVPAAGVLANDTDPENDGLTAVLDTNVSDGTLTLNADGSFIYTPTLNFNGTDSFTYHAVDDSTTPPTNASSNITTVTITVNPQNDAPVAVDDPGYSTTEDTPLNVPADGVLGNDTDERR